MSHCTVTQSNAHARNMLALCSVDCTLAAQKAIGGTPDTGSVGSSLSGRCRSWSQSLQQAGRRKPQLPARTLPMHSWLIHVQMHGAAATPTHPQSSHVGPTSCKTQTAAGLGEDRGISKPPHATSPCLLPLVCAARLCVCVGGGGGDGDRRGSKISQQLW